MASLTGRLLAIALPLATLWGTPASAQSNVLSIIQSGSQNTLMVDQSRASGSAVGGLEISAPRLQTFTLVPASKDKSGVVTEAKTVDLNVLGAKVLRDQPARQTGAGNNADITVSGVNGFVGLLQDSSKASAGNRATVKLTGSGEALIGQLGGGNRATATIGSGALGGAILQDGTGNIANLDVTGTGASGRISQFGSGLNNALNVSGAGTSAALIANGVSNAAPGAAVTVQSNGAAVTITQSKM